MSDYWDTDRIETTTLSSVRSRFERGVFEQVSLAIHSHHMVANDAMFADIKSPEDIPNSPQTVEASILGHNGNLSCHVKVPSMF